MILDAGVFIALENPAKRRVVVELLRRLQASGQEPQTNEAVLAQAWRNPARQAPMSMLVRSTTVHPFGAAKVIGRLCAATNTSDVVDASLAVLADQLGKTILTTDPLDMEKLGTRYQAL